MCRYLCPGGELKKSSGLSNNFDAVRSHRSWCHGYGEIGWIDGYNEQPAKAEMNARRVREHMKKRKREK